MGFYNSENVFKLYDIVANRIIKCRDVIFFEEVLGHSKFQCNSLQKSQNILGEAFILSEGITEYVALDNEHSQALFLCLENLLKYNEFVLKSDSIPYYIFAVKQDLLLIVVLYVLKNYKAAMKCPDLMKWKEACNAEFNTIMNNRICVTVR